MFDHQLLENYGHAGDIYAQWLVGHKEDAVQQLLEVQAKIDKELRLSQRERFWSGLVACNIMGGLIAKSLGLHDYDMKAIYKWACGMIRDIREDSTAPRDDPSSVVGDFINSIKGVLLHSKNNRGYELHPIKPADVVWGASAPSISGISNCAKPICVNNTQANKIKKE
jgi:hypothetical protein